jgi:hypothetical protein
MRLDIGDVRDPQAILGGRDEVTVDQVGAGVWPSLAGRGPRGLHPGDPAQPAALINRASVHRATGRPPTPL